MKLIWIGNSVGIECVLGLPARDVEGQEIEDYGGKQVFLDTKLYVEAPDLKSSRGPRENKSLDQAYEDKSESADKAE